MARPDFGAGPAKQLDVVGSTHILAAILEPLTCDLTGYLRSGMQLLSRLDYCCGWFLFLASVG
jgi:hypothetical protein